MRALVTGALGFVGRHLVAHLESEGDEVIGIDRDDVDILDREALLGLIVDAAPSAVYHLAGQADVGGSWDTPVSTFRANAEGSLNVLDGARAAGAERVLAVISADVYGHVTAADLPIEESAPLRPVTPYGASKAAADALALQAHLGHGDGVIRVRPFNHLGPGQSDRFAASAFASRIASNERTGETEIPVGNLTPRRDVTDVRDVVRAYRMLVERGTPGDVYNVCSGRDVAVADIAETLASMAEQPMKLVVDPDLQRTVDLPVLRGDNRRLVTATGWEQTIPLEQTLADVLDDWRHRID
ncbi:MAG: NAD-dependent epimerase/dehydratase family protein [Actinomycetota bacterium]